MSTQLYSINDIQEALGIGRNKVYSLLQSGEIAAFKIGREWKVTLEAVEDYIAKLRGDNINTTSNTAATVYQTAVFRAKNPPCSCARR